MSLQNTMSTVEIRSVDALFPEWEALADATGASPFMHPGWFATWWNAFGTGRPAVFALRRHDGLAAVLPLFRRWGQLWSMTNWHTHIFGVLAKDDAARMELLEAVLSTRRMPVLLAFLPVERPDPQAAHTAAESAGMRLIVRETERSPYVPIDGDWERYLQGRPHKRLTESRRRRRRLSEQGRLWLDVQDGSTRLEALLEEAFRVEGSGWKSRSGTAIASSSDTIQFYTDIAHWAARRGWLRLAFLRLDERPLAVQLLIQADGAVSQLKGGFDEEYGRFSPGLLLAEDMLERAFAEGLRSYDFLGADEAFKMDWARDVRVRMTVQAFPRTVAGMAGWAAWAFGRPAVIRLRELRSR
jgi:CelD/BcsL family acetyltransferase involved in cellulose biosynthesis